ncbi:MAG: hypothetical protein GY804_12625 [Alphaproteobacteria bacterium]|nr:hypothetical protein [Alphaproteobacteria bacterium]
MADEGNVKSEDRRNFLSKTLGAVVTAVSVSAFMPFVAGAGNSSQKEKDSDRGKSDWERHKKNVLSNNRGQDVAFIRTNNRGEVFYEKYGPQARVSRPDLKASFDGVTFKAAVSDRVKGHGKFTITGFRSGFRTGCDAAEAINNEVNKINYGEVNRSDWCSGSSLSVFFNNKDIYRRKAPKHEPKLQRGRRNRRSKLSDRLELAVAVMDNAKSGVMALQELKGFEAAIIQNKEKGSVASDLVRGMDQIERFIIQEGNSRSRSY